MALNLAALPSLTPPVTWETVPIGIDPVPYGQLQASSRYTELGIPDEFPWLFSTLASSDAQFRPDLLSTDGKRNLNVNAVNLGVAPLIAPGSVAKYVSTDADAITVATDGVPVSSGAGTMGAGLFAFHGQAGLKSIVGANQYASLYADITGPSGPGIRVAGILAITAGQLVSLERVFDPWIDVLGMCGALTGLTITWNATNGTWYIAWGHSTGPA